MNWFSDHAYDRANWKYMILKEIWEKSNPPKYQNAELRRGLQLLVLVGSKKNLSISV